MTTWDQLCDELRHRIGLACERKGWVGFTFAGRRFAIERVGAEPLPMIAVETVYAAAARLKPAEALMRNGRAVMGALARDGDNYVARQLLPLTDLSFGTLEQVLLALAGWAERALPVALRQPAEDASFCRLFAGFAA